MNEGPSFNDGFEPFDEFDRDDTLATPDQMIDRIFGGFFSVILDHFSIKINSALILEFVRNEGVNNEESPNLDPVNLAHSVAYLFYQTFAEVFYDSQHMFAPRWLTDRARACRVSGFNLAVLGANFPRNLDPVPVDPRSLLAAQKFLEAVKNV